MMILTRTIHIEKEDIVVAVLGLSGSGKTTFYKALNHDSKISSTPSTYYSHFQNVEFQIHFKFQNIEKY